VIQQLVEDFLNSNLAFGLTSIAARWRRLVLILVGASLWAFYAYLYNPLPWDNATAERFFFYPFRALFNFAVFPLILVLVSFFGLVLFLAPRYLPDVNPKYFQRISLAAAVLFGFLWAFLAYQITPPDWDPRETNVILTYPFQALFYPPVFRHVLVVLFTFWAAYRLAAHYLDNIFELHDISIAQEFILQAAFGSGYRMLVIKEGDVAPNQLDSPISVIGGPGLARVHLENAAIFENASGGTRVIGPTGGRKGGVERIAAFERLREVIDLRDLMSDLTTNGRTSDGILVRGEDIHIVYSVYRNHLPSTLEQPYPFDEETLLWMYYRKGRDATEKAMESIVEGELGKFISKHSLSEFLAAISVEEQEQNRVQEIEINRQAALEEGVSNPSDSQRPLNIPDFVPRTQIIADMFTAEFANNARTSGVELKWIGIGTWMVPSEIVPRRHLEAWRLTLDNMNRGSEAELSRLRTDSETYEFLRLVREIPIQMFRSRANLSARDRTRQVVLAFHSVLTEVYQNPQLSNRLTLDEREHLRRVLVFLTRFTGRWPRGGGPMPLKTPAGGPPAGSLPPGTGEPGGASG
jgi:hypothetical protein